MHEIIADGQDRGSCLTLKLAVNAELTWGNCILAMKNRSKKNPVKRLEIDLKLLKIIIRFEECN